MQLNSEIQVAFEFHQPISRTDTSRAAATLSPDCLPSPTDLQVFAGESQPGAVAGGRVTLSRHRVGRH